MTEHRGDVYLYGAGGHAKVIMDIIWRSGRSVTKLFDDKPLVTELFGISVCQGEPIFPLIIAIGNNRIRKTIADRYPEGTYLSAVDKSSVVSPSACIGEGTVVMQGAVVQSSVRVGRHAIINTGATVDHDCTIGDYAHIAPGCNLCGNVQVGEGAFIGAGTVVIPGVKIGKWSVVGAGSVVRKDIPDNIMAAGNPCKLYK